MAILIPPGFAEIAVELRATGDPDPWYVTWGVDCSASGGDIEQIGNTSITAFLSILEQISEDVTLTGAFVTLGQDGADNIRQFVPNGSLNHGGDTNGKLPQNCAVLIRKNSGQGGRRSRGRIFIPLLAGETVVSNVGQISPAALASYQTQATEFFDSLALEPGPTPMVILHSSGGISLAGPPTPVTSVSVDSTIATQRRRLR